MGDRACRAVAGAIVLALGLVACSTGGPDVPLVGQDAQDVSDRFVEDVAVVVRDVTLPLLGRPSVLVGDLRGYEVIAACGATTGTYEGSERLQVDLAVIAAEDVTDKIREAARAGVYDWTLGKCAKKAGLGEG